MTQAAPGTGNDCIGACHASCKRCHTADIVTGCISCPYPNQLQQDGSCKYEGVCHYTCGDGTAITLDNLDISGAKDINCLGPADNQCLKCRPGWVLSNAGAPTVSCIPCPFMMKTCTLTGSACANDGTGCSFLVDPEMYIDYYYGPGNSGTTNIPHLLAYINSI